MALSQERMLSFENQLALNSGSRWGTNQRDSAILYEKCIFKINFRTESHHSYRVKKKALSQEGMPSFEN